MKKNLTKLMALGSLGLLMLGACKKDGTLVTSNGGKAGTLSASVGTLVLDKTKLNDPSMVINFNFTAPNYGFSAAVTNTLQIDLPSDNWQHPTSATLSTKVYSQGYSTSDFNNLVLKLNVPAGVATPIAVRVMHSISAAVPPVYSNVLSLNVTAFNLTSYVYVPGAYEGWANPGPQEDSLVSVTGNGIYIGIINFTASNNQFLVLPVKGDWSHKYATTAPAVNPTGTSVTDAVTYDGPNNFYAPVAAGYYLVTLNINTNQITIVPADFYSVTGSAVQGWGVDTPMKYINDGNGNWVAYSVPMSVNEYKFRQDDQWTNSWGPGATAGTAVSSGATGDGNFAITAAGNYNLTFNAPATPLNSPILTTTTYSITQ